MKTETTNLQQNIAHKVAIVTMLSKVEYEVRISTMDNRSAIQQSIKGREIFALVITYLMKSDVKFYPKLQFAMNCD